ncbi:hypothetical protein HDC34_002204 [Pseudoclavibacter sp. JAI123]|uniref:hypothetical protein n=1 Tax=Pseudoclavibacter sp. JAI123 TaxID=2723065 RepID=UPI0017B72487|nr:hypothetical protein [Pseudoclavibacter sp. JAI123]NYF13910.1 hypothetical protein [Pseudoclavibacter sp. JAI123]
MSSPENIAIRQADGQRDVPLGVVMVGMAAVAWWPAFTFGAWGEVFFDDILGFWAASTAAFVFVLLERRPVWGRIGRAAVLLVPTAWLVLNFLVDADSDDVATALVDFAALLVVLICVPFTLWVLLRIVWPDFASSTTRRRRWLIVAVVGGIVVIAYVLGLNQAHFLTCDDFSISGNSLPAGCVHGS